MPQLVNGASHLDVVGISILWWRKKLVRYSSRFNHHSPVGYAVYIGVKKAVLIAKVPHKYHGC